MDFSSQRLFHGLDLFLAQRRQQFSFRAVVSDAMSTDHEGQCHVQMLMDDRLASGASVDPADQQSEGPERNRGGRKPRLRVATKHLIQLSQQLQLVPAYSPNGILDAPVQNRVLARPNGPGARPANRPRAS